METLTQDFRDHLIDVVKEVFQRAFDDWAQMFGFETAVSDVRLRVLRSSDSLLRNIIGDGCVVHTMLQGRATGPMLFTFPAEFMVSAVAAAVMIPDESEIVGWQEEEHIDAARELMNLFCGSSTHAFKDRDYKLRVSQSLDHLRVCIAPDGPGEFPMDVGVCCLDVRVKSAKGESRVWLVIPNEIARAFQPE